ARSPLPPAPSDRPARARSLAPPYEEDARDVPLGAAPALSGRRADAALRDPRRRSRRSGRSRRSRGPIIGAGVLVVAAVVAIVLASSGGGSPSKGNAAGARSPAAVDASRHVHTLSSRPASKGSPTAGSHAEAQVAVLNGTETTGLAHRVA